MVEVRFGNFPINLKDVGFRDDLIDQLVAGFAGEPFPVSFDSAHITIGYPTGASATLFGVFNFTSEMALLNSKVTGYSFSASGGNFLISVTGLPPVTFKTFDSLSEEEIVTLYSGLPFIVHGSQFDDVLVGDIGDDTLYGNGGNDILDDSAYGGNDILDGGIGNDTLIGGIGNDTYVIDNAGDIIIENPNEGIDTVQSPYSFDLNPLPNVENLALTSSAANGTGNALNNTITGNSANNILDGRAGADILQGGLGNDIYFVDNMGDMVIEQSSAGMDMVISQVAYQISANVETLAFSVAAGNVEGTGGGGDNTLTGNDGNNVLDGGAGNDTLIGNAGDDILIGGAGNDVLNGGAGVDAMSGGMGNDTYQVNSFYDTVTELANQGTDTVYSTTSYVLGNDVENLVLQGHARSGTGNGLNNVLTGSAYRNTLDGGAGNDTLNGGGGNDTLLGGSGDDVLVYDSLDALINGGVGTDTLQVVGAGGLVDLAAMANNRIIGMEKIDLTGSGNNTLTLNLQDLLDLSDTGNQLIVDGNAGDTVNSIGQGWVDGGISAGYHTYTNGLASLLVDTDVTQIIS